MPLCLSEYCIWLLRFNESHLYFFIKRSGKASKKRWTKKSVILSSKCISGIMLLSCARKANLFVHVFLTLVRV